MPYNSGTGAYERRTTTVIDATPDGDTVAVAIDVKLDTAADDAVLDLNHHKANGNHFPATSVASDSRYLDQSPAGVVSWKDGVVAANAALKDMSNVASGAIAPAKIAQDASNRFVTDTEKSTWNGALYDKADVEAKLTGEITSHTHPVVDTVPAGLVAFYPKTTAPAGWLKANGAEVSRTTYSALFAAIGTAFGEGNGSTTFNIPDLRGEFIRGLDDGRGVDIGRTLNGIAQTSQNLSHTHTTDSQGSHSHTVNTSGNGTSPGSNGANADTISNNVNIPTSSAGAHTHTAQASGGTESRPRNIALLACIKY